MRTYLRIAGTGNLSHAARDLGLSVAAVSRQLAALEEDLGVTLVTRSTRRLAITESGEQLDDAVSAARRAFPALSARPMGERKALLVKLGERLTAEAAIAISPEARLPSRHRRTGENPMRRTLALLALVGLTWTR